MQLLHHTWRSRIERLNAAAVTGSSPGKYGNQQRFSASTSRPMSSVRQNLYALIAAYLRTAPTPILNALPRGTPGATEVTIPWWCIWPVTADTQPCGAVVEAVNGLTSFSDGFAAAVDGGPS